MTTEAVIGIIVGVVTVGGTVGVWIWKLSAKLKELENQKPAPVQTMPPQPAQPSAAMAEAVARVQSRVDETLDLLKELTKWQVPGLEKVMTELAKEMARFTEVLDEIERTMRRR